MTASSTSARGRAISWVTALAGCVLLCAGAPVHATASVEQWGVFELKLKGPTGGNPYADVRVSAQFFQERGNVEVLGFYDGNGVYRVRFMPPKPGIWHYTTVSSAIAMEGISGDFTVTKPLAKNHGPVRAAHTFHFAYADGTPYQPIGTTCDACSRRGGAAAEKALSALATSPFNKVRLTVLPMHDDVDHAEPTSYPFEGTPGHFNTQRFNPRYFQQLERQIIDLGKHGIEADVILFHPYDKGHWGFDRMAAADDDGYVDYVVARLSAFRNLWWSLANDADLMTSKTDAAFERLGQRLATDDTHHHLLSFHGQPVVKQSRPWSTHLALQSASPPEDLARAAQSRVAYKKPIVLDEVADRRKPGAPCGSGCDEETVSRFWQATVAGAHADYGEDHSGTGEASWWSKGGALQGKAPARLAFLRGVLAKGPAEGVEPIGDPHQQPQSGGQPGRYYLVYFGKEAPTSWTFELPGAASPSALGDGMKFTAEVLDTWKMTTTPAGTPFILKKGTGSSFVDEKHRAIALPGRPYLAIRIKRLPPP
ncbi:MAG TPA: DUF5060 domain-containing protein [Polyangia bacterium]|nr:DUF5060 domain-containing protein [Polyangia bacterium]